MLKLYNTLSKQKEIFKPIEANKVGIYVCGVTVYDLCHIGHARTYVAFDILIRYLKYQKFTVNYVRNITDIDDKIIQRAVQSNITVEALTAKFIKAMHEDFAALNLLSPNHEPKATDFISNMITMVEGLIKQGFAYIASSGNVYYKIANFNNYCCLSKKKLEDLQAGARVALETEKQHPGDFVLWKPAKSGEPAWQSPWGLGRPGWHLECSAMAMHHLGDTIDLHGGGFDLIFPHHENELAQSEAYSGKKFANYWLHAGFLQKNKEKMSKSLNNFATIREVLQDYSPEVIRYFMCSGHYRKPLEYSLEQLDLAENSLQKLYFALRDLDLSAPILENSEYEQNFQNALNDDLNTPEALAVLFNIAKNINKLKENNSAAANSLGVLLKKLANILGLCFVDIDTFLQSNNLDAEFIDNLINQRDLARKNKDWQQADKIRQQLLDQGIILEDKNGKTVWRKIKN